MTETCRCHLPLDPPSERYWLPWHDPEPDPTVLAVAMYGQEPALLHRVRVPRGWHNQGSAANHPDLTPPKPWADTGRCWAGEQHPVVDVTAFVTATMQVSSVHLSHPPSRRIDEKTDHLDRSPASYAP